jgi:uncharacterized protein (TIGR03437 family)
VNATLRFPEGLAAAGGTLYIADTSNQRIRRVDPQGTITTIAGNGERGFSGDSGPAVRASLSDPRGLAVDSSGNVYVSDTGNNRIRRIDIYGSIDTIAGTGAAGFSGDSGPATRASLNGPSGLAFDNAGNLCVADEKNHRIRCISPGGNITTVAGNGVQGLSGDGQPAVQASLAGPFSLAVDSVGNIFFADRLNHRLRQVKVTRPALLVEPVQLSFAGNSLGAAPPSQRVRLFPGIPGVTFSTTVATESGGTWLAVTPKDGTMPATVEVSVKPGELPPGRYRGTVTLQAPQCTPPFVLIAVEFQVGPTLPARLAARPDALSFSLIEGSAASLKTLDVSNIGGGTLEFTVAATTTSGGGWLSASPQSAAAPASTGASIDVRADPSGLSSGTYTGRIVLTNTQNGEQVTVPVVMSLNAVPQRMVLSPAGLAFAAVQNGGAVPAQSFQVLNAGTGELTWSAKVTRLSGGVPWLSLSADSGSVAGSLTGSTVEVRINPAGLAAGDYYGQIDISSPQAVNSPQSVSVALKLLPDNTDPGPVVHPLGLVFRATQGVAPSSQNILVSNLSDNPISFRSARVSSGGTDWFVYLPSDATVTPERPTRIVVQPDTAKLAPGIYEGSLTLLFSGGVSRTVSLLLVNAPASATARPGAAFAEAPCTPAKLLPVFTSVGLETAVLAGWPNRLAMEALDDCGNPMVDGLVVAEFSNNDPPLALTSQQNGKWSGIWQVTSAGSPQVTIRLRASQPQKNIEGTAEFTAALRPGGDEPPAIFAGGVVSAASFAPGLPVAPGAFVSIFGARLSDRVELSKVLPLEIELAGTSATIAGRRMPLLFTSEGQINAIVPYDVPMNTTHQLVVKRGSRIATPETVTVAAAQPGILTRDQNGRGQGVVVHHSNGLYADAGNPAKAGDILVIYCLGLGPVDPGVTAGAAAPFDPLSWVNGQYSLTIGGVQAQVLFAGLAPGWAGLYQLNAIVPSGVTPGDTVPVVLRVRGQESPPVTMAIRP